MRVKHKPAYRRSKPLGRLATYDVRERIAVLTLEAEEGEEECFLAWLRRAVTEEGPEMAKLAGPDHLYEPPAAAKR